MTARPNVARVAIALGVVCSAAGNTAWAWPRSPVLVGVGLAMSAVLPVAVRLWGASRGVTGWARFERAAVMSMICGGAALYSLLHISLLLHELGLPAVIAWVPAAVMELLVVQAARAGAPVAPPRAKPAPKPKAEPKRDTSPPSKVAPAVKAGHDDEELVTVEGVTFWAKRIPDDATPKQRAQIKTTNRQRKARAEKAQMNGVAA